MNVKKMPIRVKSADVEYSHSLRSMEISGIYGILKIFVIVYGQVIIN